MDEVKSYIFHVGDVPLEPPLYYSRRIPRLVTLVPARIQNPIVQENENERAAAIYTKSGVRSVTSSLLGWPRERHDNLGVFGWSSPRLLAADLVETATGAQFERCVRVPRQTDVVVPTFRSIQVKCFRGGCNRI